MPAIFCGSKRTGLERPCNHIPRSLLSVLDDRRRHQRRLFGLGNEKAEWSQRLQKSETLNRITFGTHGNSRVSLDRDHASSSRRDRLGGTLEHLKLAALDVNLYSYIAASQTKTVYGNHFQWSLAGDKKAGVVGVVISWNFETAGARETAYRLGHRFRRNRQLSKIAFHEARYVGVRLEGNHSRHA